MKAILYSDWEKLELVEVPVPEPVAGEVLIRVGHVGICGSEIECVVQRHPRRQPPLIMGHEFAWND
jgi:threonine dehydrogenase-like Zn-dependent dehydrogenase